MKTRAFNLVELLIKIFLTVIVLGAIVATFMDSDKGGPSD